MKSTRRAVSDVQKLGSALATVGLNSSDGQRLAMDASQVVALRIARGATAMLGSGTVDHAEGSRMIAEKFDAFSAMGSIMSRRSGGVSRRMTRYAMDELAMAVKATMSMAASRDPVHLSAEQWSFATAWFARALSQFVSLADMALRSHGVAMQPVQRAVTANARRLSGSRSRL